MPGCLVAPRAAHGSQRLPIAAGIGLDDNIELLADAADVA
jgi:hypothetical protein